MESPDSENGRRLIQQTSKLFQRIDPIKGISGVILSLVVASGLGILGGDDTRVLRDNEAQKGTRKRVLACLDQQRVITTVGRPVTICSLGEKLVYEVIAEGYSITLKPGQIRNGNFVPMPPGLQGFYTETAILDSHHLLQERQKTPIAYLGNTLSDLISQIGFPQAVADTKVNTSGIYKNQK